MKKILFASFVACLLVCCKDKVEVKKEFYLSGQIKSEAEYLDKKLHGIGKNYYENGRLEWTAEYINGKKTGVYKEYYSTGQLKAEASFYNDKQNGMLIDYFENGKIKSKKSFKEGTIDGFSLFFYPNGKIQQYGLHENGTTTFYHEYDEQGNLIDDYHEVRIISLQGDTIKEGETYKAKIKVYGPLEYTTHLFRAQVVGITPSQVSFKGLKVLDIGEALFEQKDIPIGKHTVKGYFVYNDTLSFVSSKEISVIRE